ncbi:MAG: DUF4124 domain-containing protein [Pseudomonadales bacterium]|nr:DUF4124 domain-containing protein [Pseudomonadales bacterium]
MHARYPVLLLLSLLPLTLVQAADSKVYRVVDARGNVVFTDVPPADKTQAERAEVTLTPTNTYQTAGGKRAEDGRELWIVDEDGTAQAPAFVPYTTLAITSPATDTALRENTGSVSVSVDIQPALKPEHRLRLSLDGTPAALSTSAAFVLENVDRGSHSIQVEVVNDAGESLQQSAPVTFHLQRYHKPAPAPRLPGNPGKKTPSPT